MNFFEDPNKNVNRLHVLLSIELVWFASGPAVCLFALGLLSIRCLVILLCQFVFSLVMREGQVPTERAEVFPLPVSALDLPQGGSGLGGEPV